MRVHARSHKLTKKREPSPSVGAATDDGVASTRREFLASSAQVAVASLFGVTAFDAVVERVLSAAAEINALEAVAGSALSHLRDSGVLGVAHALEGGCTADDMYACNAGTEPVFDGCGSYYYEFQCDWGQESFFCEFNEDEFDCVATYSCPAGERDGFHCDQYFTCDYSDPFECGGEPGGYVCPDACAFYEICETGFQCSQPAGQFDICQEAQGKECDDFGCDDSDRGDVGYHCHGNWTDHFSCGSATGTFDCNNSVGSAYDFTCEAGADFSCGEGTGSVGFVCDTNHVFACFHKGTDFQCEGDDFACRAGGNLCGVGSTGQYNLDGDDAGDFQCGVYGDAFTCSEGTDFDCEANDDFLCALGDGFTCVAPFDSCDPGPVGGRFECDEIFTCTPHDNEQFECTTAMSFSSFDA